MRNKLASREISMVSIRPAFVVLAAVLLASGCKSPPTSFQRTIDQPGVWKSIEVRDGLSADQVWNFTIDTVGLKYDLEVIQKESGYLRGSWKYTLLDGDALSERYRSRVIVKVMPPDVRIVQVKCEANWLDGNGWIQGIDTEVQNEIYGDLQGRIGRVRR